MKIFPVGCFNDLLCNSSLLCVIYYLGHGATFHVPELCRSLSCTVIDVNNTYMHNHIIVMGIQNSFLIIINSNYAYIYIEKWFDDKIHLFI